MFPFEFKKNVGYGLFQTFKSLSLDALVNMAQKGGEYIVLFKLTVVMCWNLKPVTAIILTHVFFNCLKNNKNQRGVLTLNSHERVKKTVTET
jgi:hypothetical protein